MFCDSQYIWSCGNIVFICPILKLMLIVVLSMLATPPMAALAYRLAVSRRKHSAEEAVKETVKTVVPVVIAGFGRVGLRVGEILETRDIPYIAVDYDAGVVKRERCAGRSVFYGDARKLDVLKSLGVGNAGLVIVTIDDFQAAEQVVSSLHHTFPALDILARGHNMEHCQRLRLKGAGQAVSENLEASIALAQTALRKIRGYDTDDDSAIDRFRLNYYSETSGKIQKDPKQHQ